ncbi:MAG TPA: hypothetical protein VFF98_00090 [Novosphingobium sp.]|nr:hypothetical protein [Novosphingobium sp.]
MVYLLLTLPGYKGRMDKISTQDPGIGASGAISTGRKTAAQQAGHRFIPQDRAWPAARGRGSSAVNPVALGDFKTNPGISLGSAGPLPTGDRGLQ